MSHDLFSSVQLIVSYITEANKFLYYLSFFASKGPKDKLDSTVVAQTALFVSSMAALEKLKSEDPTAVDSGGVDSLNTR